MNGKEMNLEPDKVLAAIHQQLRGLFFDSLKSQSKQAFNDLNDGKKIPLLEISSPELGEVAGLLSLDSSDFVGKLNFSAFRDALGSHINRTAEVLRKEEKLNVFTSQETGAVLFHIPGLVQVGDQVNVLVTGLHQVKAGELEIQLMFLHPDNFKKKS